jgi:hypothetical protein
MEFIENITKDGKGRPNSQMVNLDHVSAITQGPNGEAIVLMNNGHQLTLKAVKYDDLHKGIKPMPAKQEEDKKEA